MCTENPCKSLKILADLQLSLGSSGTIFTDPQGKKAHRSVQILKESSTWDIIESFLKRPREQFLTKQTFIRSIKADKLES